MRHVDRRRPDAAVQLEDLGARRDTQLRVEVRERLVHEEGRRLADDRASQGDALPLPPGELLRLAVEQVANPEDVGSSFDPALNFTLRGPTQLEREGHIFINRHVRIEGVVLKHHGDIAVFWRHIVHQAITNINFPCRDVL